ncbi:MAG: DUF4236 domain-containing protein [Sphaerochaetaceae bacterium]|nr:DUF4236 domain-containing protein [Sphaerochaetaceae bacterium]
MSIRLQKSIKVTKGVRVNVSKSGIGISVGPKGAKFSIGPRGVYTHVGIPGTGISSRQKISGLNNKNSKSRSCSNNNKREHFLDITISIDDESGKESVTVSENGAVINNESIIRKIKKSPNYISKLDSIRKKTLVEVNAKTEMLLKIHKNCFEMTDWEKVSQSVKDTKPKKYEVKQFPNKKPDKKKYLADLEAEAKRNVKGFFGLNKKRENYVKSNLDLRYLGDVKKWEQSKNDFEKKEKELELLKNKYYQEKYDLWLDEMNKLLNPNCKYIDDRLEDLFNEIKLPIDCSISFQVREQGKQILTDVDLPEIEDFPNKKAKQLSSGKISIKEKTLKEKKKDYFTSILSISLYVASIAFSSAPTINEVIVSGYTQRLNKALGTVEDQYVYSIKFDKGQFSKINFSNIDPIETIKYFNHKLDITKSFDLKTIVPFE